MRHSLLPLSAAALCLGGCQLLRHDSGNHISRDFALGAFDKIAVAGAYDVEVRHGPTPSAHAEGGEDRINRTDVRVDGDTLHIEPKHGMNWSMGWGGNDHVKLIVTVPMVNEVVIAGSGTVKVDQSHSLRFKGEIAGSGDLQLAAVDAGEVSLTIGGSGNIRATGKAKTVTYDVAGSGEIDASALQTETAQVTIAGSGGIKGRVTGSAAVDVTGSGDVILTGGGKCTIAKSGSGDVRCE